MKSDGKLGLRYMASWAVGVRLALWGAEELKWKRDARSTRNVTEKKMVDLMVTVNDISVDAVLLLLEFPLRGNPTRGRVYIRYDSHSVRQKA